MILDLFILLSIAAFLAVGFARQEERTVKVPLTQSVRIDGVMYHPHSKGREMPVQHALAAGFTKDDFMGEEPEEDEDTGESESEGDSEDDDSSGESESEESSDGEEAEQSDEEDSKEEADQEADKQAIEEAKAEQGDEPLKSHEEVKKELMPIPDDTPEYDELIKDERFATVEALLENQEELTDINGIAEKTKQKIVEHVKSNQEG